MSDERIAKARLQIHEIQQMAAGLAMQQQELRHDMEIARQYNDDVRRNEHE